MKSDQDEKNKGFHDEIDKHDIRISELEKKVAA